MNTINGEANNTLIINKSTFITNIKGVTTTDEAKAYIEQIKQKYHDATHHITAYIIGKNSEVIHFNDDGEPSGTAGMPVLDVFRKKHLTNFVCVVTRYFGGIKLGAGGLVRAYSKSASTTIEQLEIIPIIEYCQISLVFPYSYLNLITNRLSKYELINKNYQHDVTLTIKVPLDDYQAISELLTNLTNNQIQISIKSFD